PHLQQQLRERIVHWHYNDNFSVDDIAQLAGCGKTAVYDVLERFRETGDVKPGASPGRPRILSREDIDFIASIVDDNPVIFLDEIQQKLEDSRGI
ncbi:hypothetical protein K466DRAFT_465982, partial [Polyporus arcularius HHB13444]